MARLSLTEESKAQWWEILVAASLLTIYGLYELSRTGDVEFKVVALFYHRWIRTRNKGW